MAKIKRQPELDLIKDFKALIFNDDEFGIEIEINFGRDRKVSADVEFLAKNKEYLVIEAKTHETSNAQNTRHQIFGQLMKEHGKISESRPNDFVVGILIPGGYPPSEVKKAPKEDGVTYYRDGFIEIPKSIFMSFCALVNAKYIFVCHRNSHVDVYTWEDFYDGLSPQYTIKSKME